MSIRKYKKRHRKDLMAEEIRVIVEATNEPYLTQRDVALRYRITTTLVSDLVREA